MFRWPTIKPLAFIDTSFNSANVVVNFELSFDTSACVSVPLFACNSVSKNDPLGGGNRHDYGSAIGRRS